MPQSFNQNRRRKLWNRRRDNNLDMLRHNLPKRLPDELNLAIIEHMQNNEPSLNIDRLPPKLSENDLLPGLNAASTRTRVRDGYGEDIETLPPHKSVHYRDRLPHDSMTLTEQIYSRQQMGTHLSDVMRDIGPERGHRMLNQFGPQRELIFTPEDIEIMKKEAAVARLGKA